MNNKNPYKAYTKATHTVPKTRQVVMLYDGIIRNLQQASEAMRHNRIEERFKKLTRAAEIIMGLQSCLDFDQGENTAQILYDFYSSVDSRIINLHRTNDAAVCDRLIEEIKKMREMWDKIDRGEAGGDASTDESLVSVSSTPPGVRAVREQVSASGGQSGSNQSGEGVSVVFNA